MTKRDLMTEKIYADNCMTVSKSYTQFSSVMSENLATNEILNQTLNSLKKLHDDLRQPTVVDCLLSRHQNQYLRKHVCDESEKASVMKR